MAAHLALPAAASPAPLAPLGSAEALPAALHPVAVYLAGLAPGSRRSMRQALDLLADELGFAGAEAVPWWHLGYQHAQALRARLAARLAPASVNKTLSALRGVLREAMRLGLMDGDQCARAVEVKSVKGSREPRGRALDAGELRALFKMPDPAAPQGARDVALLSALYGGGLRRAEIVSLDLDSFNPATGALVVRGKGNKERTVYATNGAAKALAAWLAVRGGEPGPLFFPVNRGGRIERRRMTAQAVYVILKRLAEQAGIEAFSPHDMRRTFISDLLDAGADISTVAKMAGHAQVVTTARYDRRGERAKVRAAELLHIPFCPAKSKPAAA